MTCLVLLTSLFLSPKGSIDDLVYLRKDKIQVVKSRGQAQILLPFEIKEGYHIQAHDVTEDHLIATSVVFHSEHEVLVFDAEFLLYESYSIALGEVRLNVISHQFTVLVTLKGDVLDEPENLLIGTLRYQACDERKCFFPRHLPFQIKY